MGRLFYRGPHDGPGLDRWSADVDADIRGMKQGIARANHRAEQANTKADTTQAAQALPVHPSAFSASQTPYYQDGSTYEQITATYTAPNPLGTFAGIFVVVAGYGGNNAPVKVAEDSYTGAPGGQQSLTFKLYRTGETVTLYGVPRNSVNAAPTPWTSAPSTQLTLSQVAAPAAPTGLTASATFGGNSLAWAANSEANINGYKIYRNTSNSFAGATLLHNVGATRNGALAFFDATPTTGDEYWYFITAVNTAGLEGSASTSAAVTTAINVPSGATVGGTTGPTSDAVSLGSVTGTQGNGIPDSEIKFGTTFWGALPTGCTLEINPAQGNTFAFSQSGQETGVSFSVVAGRTETLSGFIDATGATAGDTPNWNLWYPEIAQYAAGANQTVGSKGRVSVTITHPVGVTKAQCVCGGGIHGTVYFNRPQLEDGSVMTAYVPNEMDNGTQGLASGIPVQSLGGSLGLPIGDVHDRANNAIDTGGNGYLIKGGLVRWRALGGDTSGDTSTDLVDGAFKRFLHGGMSGATQACIDPSSKFVGTQQITGTLAPYQSTLATLHDRMSVRNPQNMVVDDDFEGGSYGHWSSATANLSVVAVTGQKFAHALQIQKTGNSFDAGDGGGEFDFPVKGSEYLWVQLWANTLGSTATFSFGLMTGEGGSTPSAYVNPFWPGINIPAATGWAFYSGWIQLDSAAALARTYIAWHATTNDTIQVAQLYIGRSRPAPTLNNVAIDGSGVTLGYSGYPQMVIGQGTITLSTGGATAYQNKKTLYTASTGTNANGTTISFSSLTDQSGNALPTFDTPPLVALQPYNMSTPPVLLYASGVSPTGFTLNSYSSGTPGTSSGISLSGTDTLYNVPGGGVANSVQFQCKITSSGIGGGTSKATFNCYINDTLVGTVNVSGTNNGNSYQVSQSFNTSGSPTSVNLKYTLASNSGISGSSCTAFVSYTSGTTPVSANVTCAIAEPWS